MSDAASLKISVETSDVKKANDELNKLTKTSIGTEKQTNKLERSFASLSTVLGTVGVAALTAEFVKIADEMKLLDARLKMVSASTAEYVAQKKELLSISKETYSSISDITTLYTKLDPALKQLGATTKDVNSITTSFAKGLKLGGANTVEAASATLQFAQAMGSGVLRGEEFNAIAEASPKLMAYMAEGMGVPVTALRKMAEEGELTAGKVSGALLKMSAKINDDFTQIPLTVGMATQNIKTDLSVAIENFDRTTGATKALAETISGLSVDIQKYGVEITTFYTEVAKFIDDHNTALKLSASLVAGVATAYYGFIAGGAVIKGIQGITVATYGLRTALIALQASSPALLAISTALGVATAAYLAHDDALEKKNYNTVKSVDELVKAHDDLLKKRKEIQSDKFSLDSTQKKETAIVDAELKKIENRLNAIGKVRSDNVEKTKKESEEAIKSAKTLEENAKKIKDKADTEKQAKADAKKAASEAKKQAEQDAKDRKSELDGLAQIQADNAIELYNQQVSNQIAYSDMEAQQALDQYNTEIGYIDDLAYRQAQSALSFYELTQNETDKVNEKMLALFDVNQGLFNEQEMQTFFNVWNEQLENARGGYTSILDEIDSLNATSKDWTAGLTGQAKNIANILNATLDLSKNEKKFAKERQKISNENLTDLEKEIATEELKKVEINAQFAAYSNLAGAMASAFEQGSEGAIAFTALQSALGIASSWTAIAEAWALGFPQNIPAVAAVTSAVMPIISQLGGSTGGGGGGASAPSQFEQNRTQIENTYTPMTDRLDRQIELLESIDKNGSASQLGITLAATSFERDFKLWIETALEKTPLSQNIGWTGAAGIAGITQQVIEANKRIGGNVYGVSGGALTVNTDVLREGTNFVKALIDTMSGYNFMMLGREGLSSITTSQEVIAGVITQLNEVQNLVQDWAMGVVSSMDDLKDASDDFKTYFDDVTGSMYYETTRLQQAFDEVNVLRGNNSFSGYLQNTINDVKNMEEFFTDETFGLLMSNKFEDIQAQIDAVERLGQVTGQTFEGGAREALNYLESIKLVSEAMARSRENIDDFLASLRTSDENASLLAESMGVTLATSVDELASLFNQFSNDMDGLTDSELELLNTNKDLLENTDSMQKAQEEYNKTLQDTTKSISTLDGALGTIRSTIEKLRSASRTSEQNLQVFYDAMAEAQRLSKTDDYAAYADAVKKAADTSSALLNKDNFTLSRDMEFAQLVAANQFEELGNTTLTQIDYLKQIEVNTRTQIDVLVAAMDALGASINSALLQKISMNQSTPLEQWVGNTWTSSGGAVATGSTGNFNIATTQGTNISSQEAIGFVTDQLATGNPMAVYTAALANGISSNSLEEMMGWVSGTANDWAQSQGLPSFAVGTPYVTQDMTARIHQGEIITPEPFADGLRNGTLMMGNQSALVSELRTNNALLSGIITKQDQQIQILLESRDIQNGSLVVLENVEGII